MKSIVFAGSPAIAVPALEALAERQLAAGQVGAAQAWTLAAVMTNADSPRGRSGAPVPTAVAAACEPLFARLEAAGFERPLLLKNAYPVKQNDILVSFAFGHIFSLEFLSRFSLGGINIHPSLLPLYRGAAPVQQAILDGISETGLTIQRLAKKMDSGAVLAQEKVPLCGNETTETLSQTMARLAAKMLPAVVDRLCENRVLEAPQDEASATYCRQFKKQDGLIDWKKSAREIDAQVRAFTPWPLSWTNSANRKLTILEGKTFAVQDASVSKDAAASKAADAGTVLKSDKENGILIQTGDGFYAATRLQWEGKKPLNWKEFLNGAKNFIGAKLE